MIHRSGSSALRLRPMSAATLRTCSTTRLSSVSGSVKNCGACGSMAPPTTVDFIERLLGREELDRDSHGVEHAVAIDQVHPLEHDLVVVARPAQVMDLPPRKDALMLLAVLDHDHARADLDLALRLVDPI